MAEQFVLPITPRFPPFSADTPAWAVSMRDAIIENVYHILAERLQNLVTAAPIADQPAADGSLRFFYATDTNVLYFDDGTWNAV